MPIFLSPSLSLSSPPFFVIIKTHPRTRLAILNMYASLSLSLCMYYSLNTVQSPVQSQKRKKKGTKKVKITEFVRVQTCFRHSCVFLDIFYLPSPPPPSSSAAATDTTRSSYYFLTIDISSPKQTSCFFVTRPLSRCVFWKLSKEINSAGNMKQHTPKRDFPLSSVVVVVLSISADVILCMISNID